MIFSKKSLSSISGSKFTDISLVIKAYNIYHEGLVKRFSDSLCFIFSYGKTEVFKQIDENIFKECG